jgi:hypothetical protein
MDEAKLFKDKTIQELLDDLDVVERFYMPGDEEFYG